MACFVYDGIDLEDYLEVASIEIPAIAPTTPDLRYAAGRDGAALAGNVLGPLEITVRARLATQATDPREIQRLWANVAALLRTDGPRPLYLSEGLWRYAVLVEDTALEFKTYSATAPLKFVCPDPVAYGEERTVTVPSGGSAEFLVGGTYPARPAITAQAVRDGSALVWGVRLDDGDYIHIETGSAGAVAVEADCAERTCRVAGTTAMITLDSDWLELAPGTHTLSNDKGSGAATVTYAERWL